MLTDKDIQRLSAVLATRQEVAAVKKDTAETRKSLRELITAWKN